MIKINMLKLTKRTDPVVWSKGIYTPLTVEQLDNYERQGYLLIKGFFTADEVDRLNEQTQLLADKRPKNALFGSESKEGHLRFLLGIHNDEPFKKYARNGFIVSAAKQILDSDVYIYQSKVVSKEPFVGQEIPFHTDYYVWNSIDGLPAPRITNVSIFLTDQEVFNGALMVVPGSHKYFLQVRRQQPHLADKEDFDNVANLRQRRYDQIDQKEFRMIAEQNSFDCLTGRKGDVLFFDANIIHGSTDNISPFQRRQLFFTYNQISNKPANPVRPDFMVDRDYEIIR
uniref:Ectoine hydroxylase n=1 Tax=Candidatus Kentrum sp. TUN TaxID=2126343 RepID=A0A450ZHU2_9GAMM|nr:MAG: ectoine hydroxylase [Candidatus Kentron sp. TUN]VFK55217.1 MAG: ectoine hydroxylase [Candidatus Kentron sp. TUN]